MSAPEKESSPSSILCLKLVFKYSALALEAAVQARLLVVDMRPLVVDMRPLVVETELAPPAHETAPTAALIVDGRGHFDSIPAVVVPASILWAHFDQSRH